jgi:regulator of PEP synthase PpsR (kinase-PPPase family)
VINFYLISDSTGETLHYIHSSLIRLFNVENSKTITIPIVNTKIRVRQTIRQIEQDKNKVIVIYTIINKDLAKHLKDELTKLNIPAINAIQHILDDYSSALNSTPIIQTGFNSRFSESYFEIVDAINFTHDYDDGRKIVGMEKADIILIGVSRTSKTPISHYLSSRGYKIANIPFINLSTFPDISHCTNSLIVGLTINLERLILIRQSRMGISKLKDNQYVNPDFIKQELRESNYLFNKILNCHVIDVTNRSIEESSSIILRLLNMHQKNGD